MAVKEKKRLIVFDVEGVLIPRNMFLFQMGRTLGLLGLIQVLLYGFLYEIGVSSLEASLKKIFKKLAGQKMGKVQTVFEQIPATPRLQSFFKEVKQRNYCIALISSGLPTVIVEHLAHCLGADYAYGINVGVDSKDRLTGEINGEAIEPNGKMKILQKILTLEALTLHDCVVVADDRNNRCLYTSETKKIGYNPDFIIRVKSDYIVMGKLSSILPILDDKKEKKPFPSTNDFVREDIHAAGFFMPVIAQIVGVLPVAVFIGVLSIVYFISELVRLDGKKLPLISEVTCHAASQSELYGFAAAPLYYALGILLTLLVFPFPASAAAIAIFALGDSTASIFGGLIGLQLPFNKGKTLEGSVSGFVFAFLAGSLFVAPWIAVVGAAVAMFVEYLPLPVNDNVLIPLVTASVLMLLV
ncbi:MAG: haloacid dehalogenase-like hydrolase [Candidatus Bathyarchaeia archaeon]|jgi:dolichol kinase/phosphoserine phosphatase